MRPRPAPVRLAVLLVVIGVLGACSTSGGVTTLEASDPVAAGAPSGVAAQAEGRVIIDVRTPEEVADGAIVGAVNLNLQDDFRAAIDDLSRDDAYFVYCRTGNRSAQAAAIMAELGFVDVVDGGGFEDLVSAGLAST